ncbi:MAG: tRNA epoxyqueuosine(34) reductase QueG [Methyloligella sp. ZOD6]
MSLKDDIAHEAAELGFDEIGFASADAPEWAGPGLEEFLAHGWQGDMGWMAENADRRKDPRTLWPEARSVILLGVNYGPDSDPLAALQNHAIGAVATYAKRRDYHDVVKKRLKQLARFVQGESGADVKVFVDTAPVMEKPLAAKAGLGWQGKNTMLVSRRFGSWLFLGAIFTTAEIEPDTPETDHCGGCTRCLDICPTDAFAGPYKLDARRCIAYLTIEHKGHIPEEYRKPIGKRVFGCEDCLAVCPWNKFATASREAKLAIREEADNPPLAVLLALDDAGFRERFRGTPIKRTGRDRFLRNVLIAAGNSGDRGLLPHVERLLSDASPLVRAMAVWALKELAPARAAELRSAHLARETDRHAASEWNETKVAA